MSVMTGKCETFLILFGGQIRSLWRVFVMTLRSGSCYDSYLSPSKGLKYPFYSTADIASDVLLRVAAVQARQPLRESGAYDRSRPRKAIRVWLRISNFWPKKY